MVKSETAVQRLELSSSVYLEHNPGTECEEWIYPGRDLGVLHLLHLGTVLTSSPICGRWDETGEPANSNKTQEDDDL